MENTTTTPTIEAQLLSMLKCYMDTFEVQDNEQAALKAEANELIENVQFAHSFERNRPMVHGLYNEHSKIIFDVLNERQRQNEKFGANRTQHPFLWNTILQEEVGEAAKDSLDIYFSDNPDEALKRYRKELIEVASVAIATIQDLDNNGIFNQ